MPRHKALRKSVLGSLAVLSLASLVGAYGTFAYFNDTESIASNLFTAGTLNLTMTAPGGTEAIIGHANFAPGDVVSGAVTLVNAGTISSYDGDGHSVSLALELGLVQTDAAGGSTDMADYLKVNSLTYDGASLLSSIVDQNGNGVVDLADLAASGVSGLADPGAAGKILALEVEFMGTATNALQGDSVGLGLTFTLAQS